MSRRPPVFTIPSSVPFLPALASAMLNGELVPGFSPLTNPMVLAAATVFLPTRRSARAFEYAILDALGTDAALLPRIVPLGDLDEDALAFSEDQPEEEILPAVSVTERRLVLAQLVAKFAESKEIASSPASAIRLADELAKLFDDLTIAGISVGNLRDDELPEHLDKFWQDSLGFLKIAWQGWHAHLREIGKEDPARRRDLLLARKADDLRGRKGGPFIAAGSTGTIPAVANLLAAISEREDGAVVLPGLDQTLDDSSYRMIQGIHTGTVDIDASFGHPQFGLSMLLAKLKIERKEVRVLGGDKASSREVFLTEAFRPAESADLWNTREQRLPEADAAKAIGNLSLIEAADPREEALAAAIVLRQSVEIDGHRAAFVTPDRALARRVAAELRRWNISVDDSAGIPLAESEAGRFARLAAAVAAEGLSPVVLLAFLRHPLNKLAESASIDALELAVLRGPRPAGGATGLVRAVAQARSQTHHRRDRRSRLTEPQWDAAQQLARKIAAALEPLLAFAGKKTVSCSDIVAAHRESLTRCDLAFARDGATGAFELGEAMTALQQVTSGFELNLADYAGAFSELLRGQPPIRREYDPDDRIRILGPLEARLLQADQILIGGLNEGTWPPETHADAWLNRPLRKQLGLDLPERRIGLTAHDFVQALGMDKAILSRAKKQNGVETVASRFLQRMAAIAPGGAWSDAKERGEKILAISHALENRTKMDPIQRPAPMPPADARPSQLSVTDIETLVRDPYSIYARDVLGLAPLDELDADPGAAERGTIIHEAFAEFVRAAPKTLPPDALEKLLEIGRKAFARIADYPELRAIWWPRFLRAAYWIAGEEDALRADIEHAFAEIGGSIEFDAGGRPFRLTARADRIDLRKDGSVAIFDYKTGNPPSLPQMLTGLAPQLPLEAAIAKANGFRDIGDVKAIAGIFVLAVSGGLPPGELLSFNPEEAKTKTKTTADSLGVRNFDDLARLALEKTDALLKTFARPDTPYLSIPRPKWRSRFGKYDHLARIKEWSANEEGTE